jgi:hypothetical protein
MECRLAGETEVLGENLPQRHFCPSQNPIWPDPVLNQGRRLSYGAAKRGITTDSVWEQQNGNSYAISSLDT